MFQSLIDPMFAMIVFMFIILLMMGRTRVAAVKAGRVKAGYFKTYQGDCPDDVLKISRHYKNLFELPPIFLITCLAAMSTHVDGSTMVLLAWVFVVLRVLHAFIHIGSNKLPIRMGVFTLQWIVVLAMWVLMLIALNAR